MSSLLLIAFNFSIEGVVVAAEFEEKLLDAWQKDEDEREKKLKEVCACLKSEMFSFFYIHLVLTLAFIDDLPSHSLVT